MAVEAGRSGAKLATDAHGGHIAHRYRHATPRGDHGLADLVQGPDARVGPHQIGLAAALHEVGAYRQVGGVQGLGEFGEGDAKGRHLHGVGLDHELLLVAADGVHAGDPGHAAKLGGDDPVLDGPQIGGAGDIIRQPLALGREEAAVPLPARFAVHVLGALGREIDRVHEHFAKTGCDRADLGLDAFRQAIASLGQAFADLLAGEVEVHALLEDGGDLGKAVAGEGAGGLQARDAGQGSFHGEGDAFFDLDGREARIDGVDLHLLVGDVGHRVDRQAA